MERLCGVRTNAYAFMNNNIGDDHAAADNLDDLTTSDDVVVLENNLMRAEISKATGFITKLANKKKNIQIPLSLEVAYYQAFQDSGPKSGAYAFVPDSNKTHPVTGKSGATSSMLPDVTMLELQTISLAVDDGLVSVPRVCSRSAAGLRLNTA
uniref:Glycosyl hydrolase family 38 C-terminal domain-containing protein n=1 Tax=Peronospora matthiolae TaxID=2874970 RepID=A0AAV1T6K4_9STRA